MPLDGSQYQPGEFFDELFAAPGEARPSSLSPRKLDFPRVVVLTPGIYNSAYFEHSYLAQRMGVDLVEGTDLVVGDDECVYVRTIRGLERVGSCTARSSHLDLRPLAVARTLGSWR